MIELREVSKTVQSGSEPLTILHPLSITIPHGQFVAIVGPSGSGKSTLLGLIAGLDTPSGGSIAVDGEDVTLLGEAALARFRRRTIGFVFQSYHLIPTLTAAENVAVPLELADTGAPLATAARLLGEVGLAERAHHYPAQLSGGEQQRVAIARAVALSPPLLLADEPTGNLDSATGGAIIELLLALNRERGSTLLLVTHDAGLAARAARAVALRDGRVVKGHHA